MFWLCATIGALMPLLPLYLTDIGLTASDFAFLLAIQSAVAMAIGQVMGYLADTKFNRTRLLLWMALFGSLSMALFPLLPPSRLALGIGISFIALFISQRIMIYNAIMLDSHRGEELYGRIRLLGSVGFAVVAVGVGWLTDLPMFGAAIMWPALVVIEFLFAISVIRLKDVPPEQRAGPGAVRIGFMEAQRVLFGNRLLVRFFLFAFILQLFATPGMTLQINLLRELGASGTIATGSLALGASVEVIIFYYGAQLVRRFHLMTLFALVPVMLVVRWGLVSGFASIGVIFATNVLHMFTFGLAYLLSIVFLNREVPHNLKSSGQTLFGLVFAHLAMLLGNLGASGILSWFTDGPLGLTELQALRALYGVGTGGAVLAVVALIPMMLEYNRRYGPGGPLSGVFPKLNLQSRSPASAP